VEISFTYNNNKRVDEGEDLVVEYQFGDESDFTVVDAYPRVGELTPAISAFSVIPGKTELRFRFRNTANRRHERYFIDNIVIRGII